MGVELSSRNANRDAAQMLLELREERRRRAKATREKMNRLEANLAGDASVAQPVPSGIRKASSGSDRGKRRHVESVSVKQDDDMHTSSGSRQSHEAKRHLGLRGSDGVAPVSGEASCSQGVDKPTSSNIRLAESPEDVPVGTDPSGTLDMSAAREK